jgi:hypothetical protein
MKPFLLAFATLAFLFVPCTGAQVQSPLDVHQALGFVRQMNTIQVVIFSNKKSFGSETQMLIELVALLREHVDEESGPGWTNHVNFASREILPGWKLDFALVEKGYRLILTGKDDIVITDETAVIYHAPAVYSAPKAAELKGAKEFPGAGPICSTGVPVCMKRQSRRSVHEG